MLVSMSQATAGMGSSINLLRVIRLFRLAVIINRLQRSRDAASMRRKRAMYRRLGAPVEKVLAFLTDLRARMRSQRDQYNSAHAHTRRARPIPSSSRARMSPTPISSLRIFA